MAELVHGTAIATAGRAVLIRGASGAGKSDLALRCLGTPPGAFLAEAPKLVADDQVLVAVRDGRIVVSAPPTIRGLIEVRGLGLVAVPTVEEAELALVVDLVRPGALERMPAPAAPAVIAGLPVARVALDPHEMSAPLKLFIALGQVAGGTGEATR